MRAQIKDNIKVRVIGLYVGNSPMAGEFPAQNVSNAENVSIRWRHLDSLASQIPTAFQLIAHNGLSQQHKKLRCYTVEIRFDHRDLMQ